MDNLLSVPPSPQPISSSFGGDGVELLEKGVTETLEGGKLQDILSRSLNWTLLEATFVSRFLPLIHVSFPRHFIVFFSRRNVNDSFCFCFFLGLFTHDKLPWHDRGGWDKGVMGIFFMRNRHESDHLFLRAKQKQWGRWIKNQCV